MSIQPRVGIWMAGISTLQDCHLWAAAMSFLMSQTVSDKLLQPDMAFLVAVFLQGQPLHQIASVLLYDSQCLAIRSHCVISLECSSCWALCAGARAEPLIFEGAPCLGKDLSLPIWTFSARAGSTAGSAPAVISLSQPKVKSDAMKISPGAGIHLPASLLAPRVIPEGVCATQ